VRFALAINYQHTSNMDYHNQYSGYTEAITLEVEQLAKYMFTENTDDKRIGLDIHGLGHSKDLFCFCLDLFCKGIVFVCGENGRADVDAITVEQFHTISKKMLLAGIKCNIDFESMESDMTQEESRLLLHKSISDVKNAPDNLDVAAYFFKIKVQQSVCTLRFNMIRI